MWHHHSYHTGHSDKNLEMLRNTGIECGRVRPCHCLIWQYRPGFPGNWHTNGTGVCCIYIGARVWAQGPTPRGDLCVKGAETEVHVCTILSRSGQTKPEPGRDGTAGTCRITSKVDKGTKFFCTSTGTVCLRWSGGLRHEAWAVELWREPQSWILFLCCIDSENPCVGRLSFVNFFAFF